MKILGNELSQIILGNAEELLESLSGGCLS